MSFTAEKIYRLLPAIHRIRDAEQGYPLRELLEVIAEQVGALEENLDQLYDDQFIETCAPWAAPYIGGLIGYRGLHGVAPEVASPRADVANTIRYRRRKGTAAMLEQVARDVTGWPARAVEFFQLLGWTQHMNHVRPEALQSADLRQWERLGWVGTAFDTLTHTVDVRRIRGGSPRPNIPNIGLFLWRVRAYPLTRSPAPEDPQIGAGLRFRFDPLGSDKALFNEPETEQEITHLAEPRNLPMALGRRRLKAHLEDYYGADRSLYLELDGNPPQPVPRRQLRICDLTDIRDGGGNLIGWAHQPAGGSGLVAIDPVLGRIAFADAPAATVLASFRYGFTSAIGGGEYERSNPAAQTPVQRVQGGAPLQPLLDALKSGGTLEVSDSGRYEQTPSIEVNEGKSLVLRAASGARPLLLAGGDILLTLGPKATLILDGLVIAGGTLRLNASGDSHPRFLILRDCTLVPGRSVGPTPDEPGLVVSEPFARVELERCILSPTHIAADAQASFQDCILDATEAKHIAFRGPGADTLAPGAALTMTASTVVGKVHSREICLGSDSLFVAELDTPGDSWKAPLWAERRQSGCLRFSFVPPGSLTPRRYRCQPDAGDPLTRPHFTSLRYGDPGYCQLRQATPASIRRGAHDEGEMGVLHGLYQPQREINLYTRLDEYLRFGLEAGLIYAS